ncbi:hypothetical protein TPHA_0O01970 [Tetrapisispora phaffii CBS 4417]|uniref:Globin domain-containing protein n=1 Tax=Tetrapisispora phaffii (strain ATCC 24235 / CBS 4417 / NBRC 1672 / NRRL Y-8282 / UCD 70-5) TaxID=1071381 RepID=G8C1Y5_TETPH|nr:hypothetical protein TPHA_0O01970 [Tetrapisispora phaffii CBS 4417]CCE66163.1 hypothetical protein TPHA_0O01970 [Tetrapisispora phaffii CBS 4417]
MNTVYKDLNSGTIGLTIDEDNSSSDELEHLYNNTDSPKSVSIDDEPFGSYVTEKEFDGVKNIGNIIGNESNQNEFEQYKLTINLCLTNNEKQLLRLSWDLINHYSGDLNAFPYDTLDIRELHNHISKATPEELMDKYGFERKPSEYFYDQFYNNLIEMNPRLEIEFPTLRHQAKGFSFVLEKALDNFDDLDAIDIYMEKLGKRHARILGINRVSFELMGEVFSKTINERLGEYHTLEIQKAWSKLYIYLANRIIASGIDPIINSIRQDELVLETPVFYKENEECFRASLDESSEYNLTNILSSIHNNPNSNKTLKLKDNVKSGLSETKLQQSSDQSRYNTYNQNGALKYPTNTPQKKRCAIM